MLCRLGLRPRSTSTLATLAVANFMAILAYVNKSHDGLVCSYASDPILTLGATQVWYAIGEGLPKYILPQLKKLMLNEMIDTKGTDAVARIILLLVMDTSVMLETHAGSLKSCLFTGQFVHVNTLLQVLGGSNWRVMKSKSENANKVAEHAFKAWLLQWEDWKIGFTHFLQLDLEPNEDTLWFLLTRRAAGVFSLDSEGSYLVIPVFCASNVSLIVVQVFLVQDLDQNLLESEEKLIGPSPVFSELNPLKEKNYIHIKRFLSPTTVSRRSPRLFHASATALHVDPSQFANNPTVNIKFLLRDGSIREVAAKTGMSILDVAHANDIDLEGACESSMACSTCHVILEDPVFEQLEEACEDEEDMLDMAFGLTDTSRLGCQVFLDESFEGTTVTLPKATRNFYVDGHVPKPH
ncbi:hypothetical protein PHYBOEH_009085 [Phytophthora boehmeriae]|uniref:2Fe-2S ferredoxin-type domain-containing protein n=1 Tax=Phytophthora boehmeriae TaxID=109152 RepID=A0A8T1VWP1_9STRA|nr:hypothetical protein PHYBOEH_009085 [Phytophthora boehmeriae]